MNVFFWSSLAFLLLCAGSVELVFVTTGESRQYRRFVFALASVVFFVAALVTFMIGILELLLGP
jgi:hypothetical protein